MLVVGMYNCRNGSVPWGQRKNEILYVFLLFLIWQYWGLEPSSVDKVSQELQLSLKSQQSQERRKRV